MFFNNVKLLLKLINIQYGYRPMDFINSIAWGMWGGGGAFISVWGKIRVKMTEAFNVNTNKHKMLCTTVILICNKIKNYLQNLFTKMSKFFNWEITRLIQFHDCLFIEPRTSWWSETQTILPCTSHWSVCNSAKLIYTNFRYVASHRS